MRRIGATTARATLLGVGLLLGGCSSIENSATGLTDNLARVGQRLGAPWGGTSATAPEQGTTIARLTGAPVATVPLLPEEGDVWPVPEAPRATLANPDAAMRGIPSYRPGEFQQPGNLPPGLRGTSTPPPPPLQQPELPPPQATAPPVPDRTAPPPRRLEGRVIPTPSGPAITTGGTDRVQSIITPDGQSGIAIPNGGTTTLITPGGPVQTVPSPR